MSNTVPIIDQIDAIGKTYSRDCKNYISVHLIFLQPQNAMQRWYKRRLLWFDYQFSLLVQENE